MHPTHLHGCFAGLLMFFIQNLQHQYGAKTALTVSEWQSEQGTQWLLRGRSGSGKTTLLHIMAGLLRPSSGKVSIAGYELQQLQGAALDRFRGNHIGIVFQQAYLVKTLNVLENLLMARYMAGKKQDKTLCLELLGRLGVAATAKQLPHELSQGQAQRISIARALVNQPSILFADEPTSSLDDENTRQVVALLLEQAQHDKATLIISTHDNRIVPHFKNVYELG